jgi:predicted DNA-binding transcriptional regulator YafY
MKILYKPFGIVAGLIGARLGRKAFKKLWTRIDAADPPEPTTAEASFSKVVGAAALEAATLAGIAAAVDRASARAFHYLTGIWPGKRKQEPPKED